MWSSSFALTGMISILLGLAPDRHERQGSDSFASLLLMKCAHSFHQGLRLRLSTSLLILLLFFSVSPISHFAAFASPMTPPSPPSLSSNLSLSQISLTRPTPSANFSHALLTSDIHCVDVLNPFSRRPKYADCASAIARLPSLDVTAAFHNGGPDDPFRLPVSKTVNTCTVRVELNAGSSTTVGGSWVDVKVKLGVLNQVCLWGEGRWLPLFKGGWTTYGKGGRVGVSLGYKEDGDVER